MPVRKELKYGFTLPAIFLELELKVKNHYVLRKAD